MTPWWRTVSALGALLAVASLSSPVGGQAPPASRERTELTQPVTVDADRMERFGREGLVVFTGNVVARQDSAVHYADRLEVYLDERGERIVRTVSTGGVRIVTRDCRTGTARRAEYFDLDQRVVLSGDARVWIDEHVVSGDRITIYLAQDRSVVEGGTRERVTAVFHPRDAQRDGGAPRPASAPCVQ